MKILLIAVSVVIILAGGASLQMFFKNKKTPKNLGVTAGRLSPVPGSPNAVSSQTGVEAKRVAPFPFKGDLTASKNAIKKILQQYGNMEVVTETDQYLHAVCTTPLMKFKDDLEFYFDEGEKAVHFRSSSRVGYSDMGLNLQRYRKLMLMYEKIK